MGFGCCQTPKSGISHSNFRFSRFRIFHDFASFIFMLHFVYVHHITCYDYFFEVLLSACIVGDPLPRPPLGGNATLAATKRHLGHSHPGWISWPQGPSFSLLSPRWAPLATHLGTLDVEFFVFIADSNSTENPRMVSFVSRSDTPYCTGTEYFAFCASALFSLKKGTLARAGSVFIFQSFTRLFAFQIAPENPTSLSPGSRRFSRYF